MSYDEGSGEEGSCDERRAAARTEPFGERLSRLRALMTTQDIDAVLIPRCDAHQGEWVPERAERLRRLTGFSGSAGMAIVLRVPPQGGVGAALFVDGRYVIQARSEVDAERYDIHNTADLVPMAWLSRHATAGMRIGYDPWLSTVRGRDVLVETCEECGATATALAFNPIDALGLEAPPWPSSPLRIHEAVYAGVSSVEKRKAAAAKIREAGADLALLTLPDGVAWLLNLRGDDLPHCPVILGFALIDAAGSVDFFVDPARADAATLEHLGDGVRLRSPDRLGSALDAAARNGSTTALDPKHAACWFDDRLRKAGGRVVYADDPCLRLKAIKNETERDGARAAHRRDGVALTRFLAWFARNAPGGGLDEAAAAAAAQRCRAADPLFRGLSFETISGAGPNGAIVHYRVDPDSPRRIDPHDLYLIDSGAQYPDGTTDVTRTTAASPAAVDAERRRRFTEVLKGHIALAALRFPYGVTGAQLDILTRASLWRSGLDYQHGAGHGVGSYLSVHEGPFAISTSSDAPLEPGLILSNEPGYYRPGAYGIRIENLVLVHEDGVNETTGKTMLAFETLTLAPIDRSLIDAAALSPDERRWLDAYHARVAATLGPELDDEDRRWLEENCRPIGEGPIGEG